VRTDRDVPGVIHMWIVADNLRKGAATNAVQIAEAVMRTAAASHG
jgi:aspartate-semialdehyde dehydrogenase